MISAARIYYNECFREEDYKRFSDDLKTLTEKPIPFRISETPVFVPKKLTESILSACEDIFEVIKRPDFKDITNRAIPEGMYVPNEDEHTQSLIIDFAVTEGADGELEPQLIELQGFPSTYAWTHHLGEKYEQYFSLPENFSKFLSDFDKNSYIAYLQEHILGGYPAENVVLLEIDPDDGLFSVDFKMTEAYLGINVVCISTVIREDRKLFYMNNGKKTPIYRIYNRVILEDLHKRRQNPLAFNLIEEIDVEWAGHPNWYFRISKYILPFIKSPYVPVSYFLNEMTQLPEDLQNYVLKPLFSFGSKGVVINVDAETIAQIQDKENYILQKKVSYAPALQTPVGSVKCEIRIIFYWPKAEKTPRPTVSFVRLSKGDIMGLYFNKTNAWCGNSVAFFQQ